MCNECKACRVMFFAKLGGFGNTPIRGRAGGKAFGPRKVGDLVFSGDDACPNNNPGSAYQVSKVGL